MCVDAYAREVASIRCVQLVGQWEELDLMYKCVTDRLVGKMIGRVEGTELHSTKRRLFLGGGGEGNTSTLNVVSIDDTKHPVLHG